MGNGGSGWVVVAHRRRPLSVEFKVISDAGSLTTGHKARKIEAHLNSYAQQGWEFVTLDHITVLGLDLGFYLVLKRTC
jgi:hypothetical protein